MTKIASIPGYNISKVGKDKYAVAVNNGNMGAVLLNKEQVKQLANTYGVPVKEEKSTAKKVATGLVVVGAVAFAAVALRKKGISLKSFNKENFGAAVDSLKGKVNKGTEFVKEKLGDRAQKLGEKIKGLYNKVAEFAGKVWEKVKTFVGKVVDKLFKKKKPEAVQLEIPFPEFQKKSSTLGEWFKEKSKVVVDIFKGMKKGAAASDVKPQTIFSKGMSAESEKIRGKAIGELTEKLSSKRPSGNSYLDWYDELVGAFGQANVKK